MLSRNCSTSKTEKKNQQEANNKKQRQVISKHQRLKLTDSGKTSLKHEEKKVLHIKKLT